MAVTGYAYDFQVDGIYYCYDVYGNAVVTHGDKKYTGKIKIPSEVKWNGKKKKVVEIGDYAFECCYELKSVSIPSSVYYIGRFAFSNCRNLESIIIPSSVISIGKWAFQYCESMTDVYCQAVNVPNTDIAAFDTSPIEKMTLYVPGESMNAYKTTAPWSGFGKFQTLTTGIEKTETAAKPMITTADGQIAVSGLSGNATIQVLSLDGKLLDSTNATDGIATLNAQPGEVVIVKVGTESYKVVVR